MLSISDAARQSRLSIIPLLFLCVPLVQGDDSKAAPSPLPPLAFPHPRYDVTIKGRVVLPDGTPAVGAKVWVHPWRERRAETVADNEGRYQLTYSAIGKPVDLRNSQWPILVNGSIRCEAADGKFEWEPQWHIRANPLGKATLRNPASRDPNEQVLELVEKSKTRRAIPVKVQDEDHRPIASAKVVLESRNSGDPEIYTTDNNGMANVDVDRLDRSWSVHAYVPNMAIETVSFLSFRSDPVLDADTVRQELDEWITKNPLPLKLTLKRTPPFRVRAIDQAGRPLIGLPLIPGSLSFRSKGPPACVEFVRITDQDGWTTFDYLPVDKPAMNESNFDKSIVPSIHGFTILEPVSWYNNDQQTLKLARLVPVEGRIRVDDKPAYGSIDFRATDGSHASLSLSGELKWTGSDGTFFLLLAPNHTYTLTASTNGLASREIKGIEVKEDQPIAGIDIPLHPLARVTIDLPDAIDVPEAREPNLGRLECSMLRCEGIPLRSFDEPAGPNDQRWLIGYMRTDSLEGRDESPTRKSISLSTGTYVFFGEPWHEPQILKITDSTPKSITIKDPPGFPGQAILRGELIIGEHIDLRGETVSLYPLGQPASTKQFRRMDAKGQFTFLRPKVPCLLMFNYSNKTAATIVDPATEYVKLVPTERVRVSGKLIGLPPLKVDNRWEFRLRLVTDAADGRTPSAGRGFLIDSHDFEFDFEPVPFGVPLEMQITDGGRIWYTIDEIKPEKPGKLDLGEIHVDTQTIDTARNDPLESALHTDTHGHDLAHRINVGMGEARQAKKNLLVVFGDPAGKPWKDLGEHLKKDDSVVDGFQFVALSVAPPFAEGAHRFVPWFDVDFAEARQLVIAVISFENGELLARFKPIQLLVEGQLDLEKVAELLAPYRR